MGMSKMIRRRLHIAMTLATVLAASVAGTGAAEQPAPDKDTLVFVTFEEGAEIYQGVPYYWLGRQSLSVTIDVAPREGDRLELYWGSKNDQRAATITVNGRRIDLEEGGYDGFRWLPIPLPKQLNGSRYELQLDQAGRKAAFLGALRLARSGIAESKQTDISVTVNRTAPKRVPAFPEMQTVWDREPPPPQHSLSDPRREAALRQAERNARLANEQFYRCRRFVDGWLAQADPKTGLIPRNLTRDRDIWNAKDSAADNYPFMVLTTALTDRELFEGRMLDMLKTETRLTSRIDRLPDTWSFSKQGFQSEQPNLDSIIFGGSEYVKDGLLPLTEWLGTSPWSERMIGIMDDIWKHAHIKTPFGNIPSTNVEVNGEMLQSTSRVFWMTGDEKYLDYAIRLGDYYLLGDHHPTRDFDQLRLRDHGCEITSGLSELYVAVHFARPEKKEAYRDAIHAMYDRILEVGRDERGMLYNTVNPKTGEHSSGICDTWGYNYNGIYTVFLLDGTTAYRDSVRHVLSQLYEHLTDYHWGSADEYADSIEGAINLYNREPVPSAAQWIDSEIHDMWNNQRPDGVVEGWHGDGNSARTAIMYALWKTQGATMQPWRADVRWGSVRQDGHIFISLTADEAYEGRVVFDKRRHHVQMHLPLDYPRINQFPEWFTVEPHRTYLIVDLNTNKETKWSGKQMLAGIPVELEAGAEARWQVSLVEEKP